jgi:O-antigen ligase
MNKIFLLISALLLALAFLLPFHKSPWPTFGSEILTFLSASLFIWTFYNKKIEIPRPQVLVVPMLSLPILQWCLGLELYFSNALICFVYVLMFWVMVIAGYNLSKTEKQRELVFEKFAFLLLVISLISSVIAIFQWLHLSHYFEPLMYAFKGNRPYANLAQPNNLATLLTMGLLSCLYFFEKRIIENKYLIPCSLILIFSIALTQSRTSWVVCLFILCYWTIKQFNQSKRLDLKKSLMWVGFFVLSVATLPFVNHVLASISDQAITETASAIERATSGYLRLDMWSQILIALKQNPWIGYGWNQTGMAQIAAFDAYPSHEWYKSAHNIILDILVWNGLIIGGLIVLYFTAWLYWLNKGVKDTISIVATLMVCAVLIHGLLEYPLHYAYFLLPVGFLLGIIQGQYKQLPSISIHPKWLLLISLCVIMGSIITIRDYSLYKEQSSIASQTTPLTTDQQHTLDKKLILLTQFSERVWWIQLDPKTQMNEQQLDHIGKMVANLASKYDVYKYAQVLAFNGKEQEAKRQLWILEQLHRQKRTYEELLK